MQSSSKEIERSTIESILRVNHAGELAAVKFYQGQLRILKDSSISSHLTHMLSQESKHYEEFDRELKKHNFHPTLLQPIWEKISYGLGVASALFGTKTAMACTVAIEEVIEEHYATQLETLPESAEGGINQLIHTCYQEETEHKTIAQAHIIADPEFKPLIKGLQLACRMAIFLSKRI